MQVSASAFPISRFPSANLYPLTYIGRLFYTSGRRRGAGESLMQPISTFAHRLTLSSYIYYMQPSSSIYQDINESQASRPTLFCLFLFSVYAQNKKNLSEYSSSLPLADYLSSH